jgi:hypothetical protein
VQYLGIYRFFPDGVILRTNFCHIAVDELLSRSSVPAGTGNRRLLVFLPTFNPDGVIIFTFNLENQKFSFIVKL